MSGTPSKPPKVVQEEEENSSSDDEDYLPPAGDGPEEGEEEDAHYNEAIGADELETLGLSVPSSSSYAQFTTTLGASGSSQGIKLRSRVVGEMEGGGSSDGQAIDNSGDAEARRAATQREARDFFEQLLADDINSRGGGAKPTVEDGNKGGEMNGKVETMKTEQAKKEEIRPTPQPQPPQLNPASANSVRKRSSDPIPIVSDKAEPAKGSTIGGGKPKQALAQLASAAASSKAKKQKLSVLEQSTLDWQEFVTENDEEDGIGGHNGDGGLAQELVKHERSREAFLPRQEFLERADWKRFEREKELREQRRRARGT